MEARLNAMLRENNQTRTTSRDSDTSEDMESTATFDLNDMLVTNECEWVRQRRKELMQTWKGLKQICTKTFPDEKQILGDASFGIFASFIYRWTAAESDSDTDTDMDLGSGHEPADDTTHGATE